MKKKYLRRLMATVTQNRIGKIISPIFPAALKKAIKSNFQDESDQFDFSNLRVESKEGNLVSIVLPVYNHEELLPLAIESVLEQTHSNFELIIVDDGSDKVLLNSLEKYLSDCRVKYIRQVHAGLPCALNTGFSYAKGDFLLWTSADNIMGRTNVEEMLLVLLHKPEVVMVYCDYVIIDKNGIRLRNSRFRYLNQDKEDSSIIRLPGDPWLLSRVHDNFIGPCFMYRRLATSIGEYNNSLGVEDYDYWLRIVEYFPIVHLKNPSNWYKYRIHDNTLSSRAKELSIFEKSLKLLKRSQERREFIKENITVILNEAFTGYSNLLRKKIEEKCRVSSETNLSNNHLMIVDLSKIKKDKFKEATFHENLIILVDSNSAEEIQKTFHKYQGAWFLFNNYIELYYKLKNESSRVFWVEGVGKLSETICAIAANRYFDKQENKASIEIEVNTESCISHLR